MIEKPSNFALIGAAGYIAPRHMKAIKDTGNLLVAALDPFDSVGVIDSYFPEAHFFTEPERFDRHLDKLRRTITGKVDYVSICSPNYLHDAHIRMALRNGAHAICEKPLVLNPWNLDALSEIERETGKKVFTILQLRHHPVIMQLKKEVSQNTDPDKRYHIQLEYITSRGSWYHHSWKGNTEKSGGIATNIGVHFFDMLTWIFGPATANAVTQYENDRAAGHLTLAKADVDWFLSINAETLPNEVKQQNKRTYRSLTIEGKELEFSDGFTDLHTVSYQNILNGTGFGLEDAMASVQIVHEIRQQIH
jgi:UDP-N-acetyl-2-amino-2-deoxyglucuronate dehydrogenase